MKQKRLVTGIFLSTISLLCLASPLKVFAEEDISERAIHKERYVMEESVEETEVILPDTLSEEDETAILAMVSSFQRSRSASTEKLEYQISNYLETNYGTTTNIYIIEFKSLGNGQVGDRVVYVLMGNSSIQHLSDAAGGFSIPTAVPRSGFAFENWIINDEIVSNDALAEYDFFGSTIIYASFSPDTNGDGIPDNQQNKYIIHFTNGTFYGKTSFEVFEPIDGSFCYIRDAVGFSQPKMDIPWGFAFDYWIINDRDRITDLYGFIVKEDLEICPVFAEDANFDSIPDYKQLFYKLIFTHTSGGTIDGTSEYLVVTPEYGTTVVLGDAVFNLIVPKPIASSGYMFDYWIDQYGQRYDRGYPYDSGFQYRKVNEDLVMVAVFTEDANGDNIPDYQQTLVNVIFMTTSGGTLVGRTEYLAASNEINYTYLGHEIPETTSIWVKPDEGFVLDYWIDQYGNNLGNSLKDLLFSPYKLYEDTVFVAVFKKI